MYRATVLCEDKDRNIERCFGAEDRKIKGKAEYSVGRQGKNVVFRIRADDSVALRTAMNSITKMLTVIEKTHGIGE